jgi:hypothetical protein
MKTMKRSPFKLMAAVLLGSMLFSACSKDNPAANGTVVLKMGAASPTGTTINGRTQVTTVITDFKVSFKEIQFEFDKEDDHFKTDSSFNGNEDTKLKGPFVLDVAEQNAFVQQLITTVNVPNARYEEVKFKLHKNTDAGAMNGKSILITGTIDGKPFIFWHDMEENFEIDFENAATDLVINANTAAVTINLQLDQLFSTLKGGINLSLAKDGDGDGTIEINSGSTDNDGNKAIADAIKNLLKNVTDLIEGK